MERLEQIHIDLAKGIVRIKRQGKEEDLPLNSPQAFAAVSQAWVRCGWDVKYVYSFSWLGRPIIQLPDDMMRIQEVIYRIKPDVIIETGVAHGGGLIFYASLCKAMGKGRIIGVDVEIRPHNRQAIEAHELSSYLTLIEGSSIDKTVVAKVKSSITPGEKVLICLDSCHDRDHVLAELEQYSSLVSVGSYIVAMDGIRRDVVGAPRSSPDWTWNHPEAAARLFVEKHKDFCIEEPAFPFNEGTVAERCVTYWPGAFIKRLR